MNRCAPLVATLAALFAAAPAQSQSPRHFPAQALRGEIVVTQPPEVLLNGRAARLAPGARIRGPDQLMVMSGAVVGQRLPVHYTLDLQGDLLDVWVLTPAERARRPWPTSAEQARQWRFDAAAQTWSRP